MVQTLTSLWRETLFRARDVSRAQRGISRNQILSKEILQGFTLQDTSLALSRQRLTIAASVLLLLSSCSYDSRSEKINKRKYQTGIRLPQSDESDQVVQHKESNSPVVVKDTVAEEGKTEDPVVSPPPPPTPPTVIEPEVKSLQIGIGAVWGNWLGFGFGDKAKKFDRLTMNTIQRLKANATTANLAWIDIETVEGVYDWSYIDHQVAEANKRNLEIYAYIGLTPDWALDKSKIPNFSPGIGYRYPPADKYQVSFERFMTEAAKRYKNKIKYFKFWNEPNGCSWINDGCRNNTLASATLYVKWLKIAYTALKSGNPQAKVSIGGLDYNPDVTLNEHSGMTPYLEHLYSAGAQGFFDAVTLHPYGVPLNFAAIEDNYAILEKYGDGDIPIWIGEYGWVSKENELSENTKRNFIIDVLSTMEAQYPYVEAINYLVLTDLPNEDGGDQFGFGLCSRYLDKLDQVIDEALDDTVIKCRSSALAITDFASRVSSPLPDPSP